MHDALFERIRPVTRRLQSLRLWRLVACIALTAGIVGLVIYMREGSGRLIGQQAAVILLMASVACFLVAAVIARLSFRNPRRVATQIENQFPNLKQRLLTALSQRENDSQLGYLQQRVIKEARDHSRSHRWTDVVPAGRLFVSRLSGFAATIFLMVILGLLTFSDRSMERTTATSIAKVPSVIVAPGNAEVERGTSLVITARFEGILGDAVPHQAELVCTAADGSLRRITMTQNLDDPIVGGFVASIDQPFEYQVVTPSWQSETYSVGVFEFPSLVRSDANLKYPEYTGMAEKRVEDTVRVSAVEGTEVTWICFLNKPVESAVLTSKEGVRIPLEADPELPGTYLAKLDLRETQRLTLELVDDANRQNKYPPELIARVLPNQPPKLKLANARDATVSPLEELSVGVEVRDDFGIANVGLSYTFASQEATEITLGSAIARGTDKKIDHLIEFEKLGAEPDQLLAYHFWAEDYGPDGNLRRTESDMFFAEVRPFEEIFREGQPPPGGQQQQQQQQNQNAQKAEELAELQKQIINATWTVIRQERGDQRTPEFVDNVTLLKESQIDALAQLEELAGEIEDARSLQFIDLVRGHMLTALTEFTKASDDNVVSPLNPAMLAAQAAYAGLLKLRAREFEVTRQQQQQSQSQSQSSSAQRRQQQIDELEIDQEENRYETQQQAEESSQEAEQQREIRQVLNRLRELARRQEDLNKELAQLQSALEQAETEKEKEEIERQLKRLRDQQQDLLRETDELADRMQQPENQEQMSQASQQLEETRENVRQASEALQENDASEALTAGKRAEREFEEMRDEFRQKAAGEFNETVREMRSDAQQLDRQQEELAKQLSEIDQQDASTGLRGPDPREEIQQKIQSQREQLGDLLERMQETVEQAETAEPLLAQKLYDSYRKTQQRQVDRRLQDTEELLSRGFDPQAREMERQAGEGIDQLREELEDAANSVLGDETESLQRALSELERLERSLDEELRQNNPQTSRQPGQGQPNQDAQPRGEGQQPQQGEGQQPQQGEGQQPQQGEGQQPQQGQGQQPQQGEGQQPQQGEGQQPQQGQGQQPQQGQGQQPQQGQGQQPQQGEGQQPQQGQGQQPQQGQGQQPQQGQGQQPQQGQGQQPQQGQGQQPQQGQGQQPQQGQGQQGGSEQQGGLLNQYAADSPSSPLTGEGFRDWSDRLRDVEEMVEDPELRSRAARIRDRAREVRVEFKRHSKTPQWELVEQMIAEPLRELKRDVAEELLRRSAEKHAPVPIDRDPVPSEFADAVRQYYESLGSGR